MGDRNEKFRVKLDEVFRDIKARIAACLEEARRLKEVPADLDVEAVTDFVLSSLEGTLLQMKVSKSNSHQKHFDRLVFENLLEMPSPMSSP